MKVLIALACMVGVCACAESAFASPIGSTAATATITRAPAAPDASDDATDEKVKAKEELASPQVFTYRLNRALSVFCKPSKKTLTCVPTKRPAWTAVMASTLVAITDRTGSLFSVISKEAGGIAQAANRSSNSVATVFRDGSVAASVAGRQWLFTGIGDYGEVATSKDAVARLMATGDALLWPKGAAGDKVNGAGYSKATDTLTATDGAWKVSISAYSSAAPKVTVTQNGAAVYTSP